MMNKEQFTKQLEQYENIANQLAEFSGQSTTTYPLTITVYDAGLIDFCHRYKDNQNVFFDICRLIAVAEQFYNALISEDIETPDCDQFAELLEQIINEHDAQYFVSVINDLDNDYLVSWYKEHQAM